MRAIQKHRFLTPYSNSGERLVWVRQRSITHPVSGPSRERLLAGNTFGQESVNSCHSCPKTLTSGMTGVKAIADLARRRNRSEEIYKAGAQRLVTAAT